MKLFTVLLMGFPFLSFGQETKNLSYIQNDSFVSNTFGFPPTIANFKKNYGTLFSITKTPVKNIHEETIVDTIYTFSAGKTKIEVYKARHQDLLQSAYIDTDKISLKFNIKIGDTKDDIGRRLGTKITSDKVQIGDLEQLQVYTLTFSNGKLTSIIYEGHVD